MQNLHCPAYITALLHFHTSPEPIREAPVNDQAIKLFLANGLIVARAVPPGQPVTYQTTTLGGAYIESLCLVPPPKAVYIDALGNQLTHR